MIHALKIRREYFKKIASGEKTFEVRYADREYMAGDYLALNEIDEHDEYTNRSLLLHVTNVFAVEEYCKEGYVILSFEPADVVIEPRRCLEDYILE